MKCLFPLLALVVTACAASDPSPETGAHTLADMERCGVDAGEYQRLMALDLDAFDQDFEGGWRAVDYRDGCSLAAANMITDYIARYGLTPSENKTLFWHAGQMFAGGGKYEMAQPYFMDSRGPDNTAWAIYADGTIAFIDNDRAGLETAIAELSKPTFAPSPEQIARQQAWAKENGVTITNTGTGKPANLVALEGLLRCFGQPYAVAYGQCPA